MERRNLLTLASFILLLSILGCATIPQEAPELSAELGKRISAIEASNITLLHRFFDQKRTEVNKFIENEWVPTFAEEFFSNPKISEVWNTIVREDDNAQRLKFIVTTGPKLQQKINKKRIELIQPLDDLERRIENRIRDEYEQARAINNTLTSFLLSASKVAENRNRYLAMVGVTDETIGNIIDKTDDAVSNLLKRTKDAQEKVNAAEEYIEKLRSIRNSI